MAKYIMTKKEVENKNFKITVGTTKKNDPKTFYIEFNCFVTKNNENDDLEISEIEIAHSIRKLSHKIANYFNVKKDTLAGATMSSESINNGKASYFTAWIYLMQDTLETKDFNGVYDMAVKIIEQFTPEIEKILSDNNLDFRKDKK